MFAVFCQIKRLEIKLVNNEEKCISIQSFVLGKKTIICGVLLILAILFNYKYLNFSIKNINYFFDIGLKERTILAPLGISFITFSAISYLVDIYTGKAKAGNIIDCLLYLTFFPKIVSGPIVLWRDFQNQIQTREININKCVNGVNRIIIGFAKKLILADMFGMCIGEIQKSAAYGIDIISAWLCVLLYMLQIYYDFAGYSDIAIGVAKILGFDFKENFNFPYRSRSISEFWRRWHISLGTWFREYVYIPLGGSRMGKTRTIINLAVVFFLTGIWHGASWTYIIWGATNGGIVIIERIISDKSINKKIPNIIKWSFSMFVVMICWELFRFQNMSDFWSWVSIMLGRTTFAHIDLTWRYFLDYRMIVLTSIGILGATVLGESKILVAKEQIVKTKIGFAMQEALLLCLFVVSLFCMVSSSYHPFIYFQY